MSKNHHEGSEARAGNSPVASMNNNRQTVSTCQLPAKQKENSMNSKTQINNAMAQIHAVVRRYNAESIEMLTRYLDCSEDIVVSQLLEVAMPEMQRRIIAKTRLESIEAIYTAHLPNRVHKALGYIGTRLFYFDGEDLHRVSLKQSVDIMRRLRQQDGSFDESLMERWERETINRLKAV